MRFLIFSTVVCVVSFSLSGVFYTYADFDKSIESFKNGKYNINMNFDTDKDIERKASFEAFDVKKINIKYAVAEIDIKPSPTEKLDLNAYFTSKKASEKFKVELKEGTLFIATDEDEKKHKNSSFLNNIKGETTIELLIPRGLVADYSLKLALGEIEIEDIEMGIFESNLAAGELDISNTKLKSGSIEAAAGDIDLEKVIATEGFVIEAAAGDVDVEMNQADPVVKIEAAAGDIDFSITKGLKPNLIFKNASSVGELSVRDGYKSKTDSTYTYGAGKGMVEIKTTFGDVDFE